MPDRGGNRFPPVRKSLGQHFLADRSVLLRIADALELTGSETVVEIGPGRGALTDLLADRAGRLIAIEYDRALAGALTDRYRDRGNVTVIQADVLTVDLGAAAGGPYRLAGNVPYYITTPIIFHALQQPRPDLAVYLVQREVAERLAARPGGGDYGALTVNVGAVATAERLLTVPPGAFRPPPKVHSAVIRLTPRNDPAIAGHEEVRFRAMVQKIFGMRRKQMQRIARAVLNLGPEEAVSILVQAGIDPQSRPETLPAEAFARLLRLS